MPGKGRSRTRQKRQEHAMHWYCRDISTFMHASNQNLMNGLLFSSLTALQQHHHLHDSTGRRPGHLHASGQPLHASPRLVCVCVVRVYTRVHGPRLAAAGASQLAVHERVVKAVGPLPAGGRSATRIAASPPAGGRPYADLHASPHTEGSGGPARGAGKKALGLGGAAGARVRASCPLGVGVVRRHAGPVLSLALRQPPYADGPRQRSPPSHPIRAIRSCIR